MEPNVFAAQIRAQFGSQRRAAAFFGVTERTIRNWCSGRTPVRRVVVLALNSGTAVQP